MCTPSHPGGHGRAGHRRDQVGPAGGVARVDDDRQVAQPLDVRHDRQVEHVARRVLERPDPALAEDHPAVALRQDVLGRHQQVLDRRAHAPLQQDGRAGPADLLEQVEVLHVPRADLDDVGVALDEVDLAGVHDLGDDRHAEPLAGRLEDLEAVLAEPLEAVGAGPRLEGAAAEDVGAGVADRLGDLDQDRLALDGARAGDHGQVAAADLDPLDLEDRVVGVELAAGELVRLEDRHDLLDAVDRLERLGLQLLLVADHADDRPRDPLAEVGREAQRLDPLEDVVDTVRGGVRLQDDDHRRSRGSGTRRPVRRFRHRGPTESRG